MITRHASGLPYTLRPTTGAVQHLAGTAFAMTG